MPRKSRTVSPRPSATFAALRAPVVEFNPDYTHVKRDLKRIGILSGAFFALLIALSFILPLTPFGR